MKAIINAQIVLVSEVITRGWLVYDTRIIDYGSGQLPEQYQDIDVIDADQQWLVPGFMDVHIHGGMGVDVLNADVAMLQHLGQSLVIHGTTSYLATTVTGPWGQIHSALNTIREVMATPTEGARLLGAHLEGPFISHEKKGAHNAAYICPPNKECLADYWDILKIITYAPEVDENQQFIQYMTQNHPEIVMSAGHSNADYPMTQLAIKNGLRSATHFFNGLPQLHHRNLNITSALLAANVYYELIADNIHVNPYWYAMLAKIKGFDKLVLITDAISATGLGEGAYTLGGLQVEVREDQARLVSNGSLAGSVLTLNRALANIHQYTDINLPELIRLATLNPARLLRIDAEYGSIERQKIADLVVCDEHMNVKRTIIAGKTVFTKLI